MPNLYDFTLRAIEGGEERGGLCILRGCMPTKTLLEIGHRVHDARDRQSLSYLAAAADGRPIYVYRALHDADLVISIGVFRLADSLGSFVTCTSIISCLVKVKAPRVQL